MTVKCNRAMRYTRCIDCDAASYHDSDYCEPCPVDFYAQCVDVKWLYANGGTPNYAIPPDDALPSSGK